jgi:hypothetical protein
VPRDTVPEEARKRDSTSRKSSCPFRASIRLQSGDGRYKFEVHNPEHNHEPIPVIALPHHRQIVEETRTTIEHMTQAGSMPREIASAIRLADPTVRILAQDIYNERRKQRVERLAGKSPIEAMVIWLENSEWFAEVKQDIDGRVTHIIFAHPKSIALLKRYPEVLLMDCTYKTNRFGLPLLDIIGCTGLNKSFFAAFVFISKEEEGDYIWALERLRLMMRAYNMADPAVIVTDRELALINAYKRVFPTATGLLCEWHVAKAVVAKGKSLGIIGEGDDNEGQVNDFRKDWAAVVNASTIQDYEHERSRLLDKYRQHIQFADYLRNWLDDYGVMFVHTYADRHRHFGNRVTSKAEGGHALLKQYLRVSTGDLKTVLEKIELLMTNMHAEHEAAMAIAQDRTPSRLRIPMFAELIGKVTPYALYQISRQLDQVKQSDGTSVCYHTMSSSMGLPCHHQLETLL